MEDLNAQIKNTQEVIHVLIKQYKHLVKENEHLKNRNEALNKSLEQKDILLQTEHHKKATENLALLYNDEEKKNLQQKIDFYLKDVEKCLSFLNA